MYHELFTCLMYDFYGLELCTIYDSHVIYLRVLWTICIYKFSRCHAVVFHDFFVLFTNFWQKMIGFWHKPPGNYHVSFWKTDSFISQTSRFIDVPGFTVTPSPPVHFNQIFLIFTEFYQNFQKPTDQWRPVFVVPPNFEPCGNQRSVQGGRCTAPHIQSSFSS
jgi:hypothetical protein